MGTDCVLCEVGSVILCTTSPGFDRD